MPKAINWPLQFREEVVQEPSHKTLAALRIGRLYYDNQYWSEGEQVDIRVNHKIIRKAHIVGLLKCCPIQALTESDFQCLKINLKSPESIATFLSETYEQPVTVESEVTVVYYQNEPIDPERLEIEDDSHMA